MTKILAHRGYLVNGLPGNTLPAFKAGLDNGADGFEFDIHLTSDCKFVCYHDDSLAKLGRKDLVKDLTAKELTSIRLSEDIYIPLLEEVFEQFGNKCLLNVEMKFRKEGSKELLEIVNQYKIRKDPDNLILSSFHHKPLFDVKNHDQEIPTGLLCALSRGQLKIARNLKCTAIHPFYNTVQNNMKIIPQWISENLMKRYAHKIFEKAKQFDILVNPWTVNDEYYLRNAINWKVDGIITDNVELALKLRSNSNYQA